MLIKSYDTPADFIQQTANAPYLIKSAFARKGLDGQIMYSHDMQSVKEVMLSLLVSSVPILGTIRGLARMYSLWSVKDRSQDSVRSLSQHSTIAIFEILGLAPLLLALQISSMVSASILILAILLLVVTVGGIGFLAYYSITKLIGCINKSCCSR
ncbi:hypothetical protein [Chlamydia psittaci]|uniref:Uncharacterized protein n=1 Tax=Chlamydia psittaci 99DC5 TaxID=1112251 RepID=A0ABN0MND0_CHLPS|nr:hypothetical protein [Chlamydia psittaci]AFS19631.1 hypothetical protein B595_0667 [Chlamydia psittaci 84/55]AFS22820.1 hypothetical protein B600_0665 [Chlamydia psittaci VS225]AGE75158.1 hypothetical protein AO9_02990 [Chlamydia psittaci Mat116]EPJ16591.1 hypothetical protein CP02DC22_1038 [Chlamydia psittaci 02DC22]EPJ20607.1 hypothetical protein CP02DC23_0306 [Chlamydia psittaci 02DC23]EPJ22874.1 hypothetical protein CP03DC29_0733 [Chlamydia psittaci 03DC29]EPJ97509.1 hypothetical prot